MKEPLMALPTVTAVPSWLCTVPENCAEISEACDEAEATAITVARRKDEAIFMGYSRSGYLRNQKVLEAAGPVITDIGGDDLARQDNAFKAKSFSDLLPRYP
jgi:hypothetical protein